MSNTTQCDKHGYHDMTGQHGCPVCYAQWEAGEPTRPSGLAPLTYGELANKCREIHTHISMLAQVKGEARLETTLKKRIDKDWSELAEAYRTLEN